MKVESYLGFKIVSTYICWERFVYANLQMALDVKYG